MPVVLEAMALDTATRKRQNWIEPVQSLNGGLVITHKMAACSGGFR
jgi:hypothetical protein